MDLHKAQEKYRQERIEKDFSLKEIDAQIPYKTLPVRDIEARKIIFGLKTTSIAQCISEIQKLYPHQILWTEINSILEILACKYRGIFAYGCSTPVWTLSSWGYFDAEKGVDSVIEVKAPRTSIEALVFLLSLA